MLLLVTVLALSFAGRWLLGILPKGAEIKPVSGTAKRAGLASYLCSP
jgi:hypothetical protein